MMDRINEDLIGEYLPPKITALSTRQPLLYENLTRKIIGILLNRCGILFKIRLISHIIICFMQ